MSYQTYPISADLRKRLDKIPLKLTAAEAARQRELALEELAYDAGLREAARRCAAIAESEMEQSSNPGASTAEFIRNEIRREFGLSEHQGATLGGIE